MNLPFDIFSFLRDTMLIMLSWFLLSTSFFSWGRFLSNILHINISGKKGIIANIWLGFVFCIFFFSIYHIFLPINAFASSLFYFPGIIFFFIKFGKKLHKFVGSISLMNLSVIVLTLFMASAVSIQEPTNFDTGLYHLNSIKWNNEFHIVKGIGNLHTRLGFNQTFFLYCSSLNFYPFLKDYAFHASNSFLYALFFVGMILNGTLIDLLIASLFFFIPMPYHWLTSPTPDLASTFVQIVTFRYFIEAIHFNPQKKERISLISFAAILSAMLITLKLSNIIYAIGLGIVTIIFGKKYNFDNLEKKLIGKTFVFITLFFIIWITRGYIQTGYPLFPSSIGGINTNWTVPKEIANKMVNNVYAGSRSGETIFDIDSPVFKNFNWLPLWLKISFYNDIDIYIANNNLSDLIIIIPLILFPSTINNYGFGTLTLFFISLILLLVYCYAEIRKKSYFKQYNILLYLLIAEFSSILFWFSVAPCLRFANGIFVILFITCILLIKNIYPKLRASNWQKKVLLFYSLILFIWNYNTAYFSNEFAISGIIPPPSPYVKELTTKSGLKILFPPTKNCKCWNYIPSTPDFNKNLSLIGNTLEEGFCIKE